MVGVNLEAGRRHGAVKSNEDSFETLFAAEYARVAGIANRVLADPHEAEDVAQEVFITVFKTIEAFREESKFSTWLYRVTVNHCKNRIKYLSRRADRSPVTCGARRIEPADWRAA